MEGYIGHVIFLEYNKKIIKKYVSSFPKLIIKRDYFMLNRFPFIKLFNSLLVFRFKYIFHILMHFKGYIYIQLQLVNINTLRVTNKNVRLAKNGCYIFIKLFTIYVLNCSWEDNKRMFISNSLSNINSPLRNKTLQR